MRLFEHADFDQAIIRAAAHFKPRGWREALIEKDYYVRSSRRNSTSNARCFALERSRRGMRCRPDLIRSARCFDL